MLGAVKFYLFYKAVKLGLSSSGRNINLGYLTTACWGENWT